MIIYNVKSKTKKSGSFVQTANLAKRVLSLFILKKSTSVFNPKMVQKSMSQYEKKGNLRIYQFLTIAIAAVILSSCQKESLSNPNINSTTPEELSDSATGSASTIGFVTMKLTIDGVTRKAMVHPPASGSGSAPVIFAFHGHGGIISGFSKKGFEKYWPEAIVVYPQGLPDGDNRPAWQHSVGEVDKITGTKDKDLKFFDAMLSTLKKEYKVDENHVFVHGWSMGGNFAYNVLWAARGDKLAALAPAGSTVRTTSGKQPMSVIQVAGTNDSHASFSSQQQSAQKVRTLDKCSSTSTTWVTGANGLLGKKYASSINEPVVFLQYNGGHEYPDSVVPQIDKFFKQVAGVKTN